VLVQEQTQQHKVQLQLVVQVHHLLDQLALILLQMPLLLQAQLLNQVTMLAQLMPLVKDLAELKAIVLLVVVLDLVHHQDKEQV